MRAQFTAYQIQNNKRIHQQAENTEPDGYIHSIGVNIFPILREDTPSVVVVKFFFHLNGRIEKKVLHDNFFFIFHIRNEKKNFKEINKKSEQ